MFADFFDLRFRTFGGSIISLAEGGKFGSHYSPFGIPSIPRINFFSIRRTIPAKVVNICHEQTMMG